MTDAVLSQLARQSLRARPGPEGGLAIEVRDECGQWARVDGDLVALARAVTRHLACDPAAASDFAARAVAMAGVDVRGAGAVEAVVRATYPLLGAVEPWPVPALPGSLPPCLQPAFRRRDPRAAARVLFGRRATRPVTRALAGALTAREGIVDVFRLSVALAGADLLEPDHLVRLLQVPGPAVCDRGALCDHDTEGLRRLLRGLAARRILSLLTAAIASGDDRARVRYVLEEARRDPVDMDGVRSWREVSTRLALAVPDVGARLPGAEAVAPSPPTMPHPQWSLHPAQSGRDLVRLSQALDNCLDTYVGRLGRHERILEVRDADGRAVGAVHVRGGRIHEFRRRHNLLPDERLRREVEANVEAGGWLDVAAGPGEAPEPWVVRLSRELLGPARPGVDWAEVGAAFWLAGLVAELPDPAVAASERIVLDLAELAVAGQLEQLPRVPRRGTDLQEVIDRLAPAAVVWTTAGWRRRLVLDMSSAAAGRPGR